MTVGSEQDVSSSFLGFYFLFFNERSVFEPPFQKSDHQLGWNRAAHGKRKPQGLHAPVHSQLMSSGRWLEGFPMTCPRSQDFQVEEAGTNYLTHCLPGLFLQQGLIIDTTSKRNVCGARNQTLANDGRSVLHLQGERQNLGARKYHTGRNDSSRCTQARLCDFREKQKENFSFPDFVRSIFQVSNMTL